MEDREGRRAEAGGGHFDAAVQPGERREQQAQRERHRDDEMADGQRHQVGAQSVDDVDLQHSDADDDVRHDHRRQQDRLDERGQPIAVAD